jgi:hypothetical protein
MKANRSGIGEGSTKIKTSIKEETKEAGEETLNAVGV